MFIEWLLNLPNLFTNPQRKLERACAALKNLPVDTESEKAWKTYQKALNIAMRCEPADTAGVVTSFDKKFRNSPTRLLPHSNEFINFLLSAPGRDVQILEAAWLLSKRLDNQPAGQQSVQQKICLELSQRKEADRLISKLQERRGNAALTIGEMTEIFNLFLKNNSLDDNPAWKPFFLSFERNELPRFHQIYALLNHPLEASELAEAAGDISSALEYLWTVPGTTASTRALSFAQNLNVQQLITRAHKKAAETFWDDKNYAAAATHFEQAGLLEQAGECYRHLEQFDLAIRYRSALDPKWLGEIRDQVEKRIRKSLSDKEFTEAVRLLRGIGREWQNRGGGDLICETEAARINRLLSEVVRTARSSFETAVKTLNAQPGAEVFKRWSLFEEEAGNYLEAGLQAEMARDYFAASLTFEKAGAFGQALAALEQSGTHPDLLRKAELLHSGGDFFMAGLLYERLREDDNAVSMYEEAGEFIRASELLRSRIGDSEAAFDAHYLSLLTKAHRTEDLAELCYSKAKGSEKSAEEKSRFLRRIKDLESKRLIGPKWLEIIEEELPDVEASDRTKFNERAEGWAQAAAGEVLADYVDAFGLDLGTTNSVVALYNRQLEKPEVVEWEGRQMFPSVFAIDRDNREIIGVHESEWIGKSPLTVIARTKRLIGTETKYKLGDRIFRPEEISARFIAHAQDLARKYLLKKISQRIAVLASEFMGAAPPDDWISDYLEKNAPPVALGKAVITVPAYFNDLQKHATRTAGELAGVTILRLIHEPTAACIAQRAIGDKNESVLVVDLGAGTLDLSLVEIGEGVYEVKEIEGDNKLGSADLDELLYKHFVDQVNGDMGINISEHKLAGKRLRQASEEMKIELSAQAAWSITLPGMVGNQSASISLTRAEFEKMATIWLNRVREACKKIVNKPSRVLLIGGGAMMPAVRFSVKKQFGLEPGAGMDPLTAVARGAAIQAAILAGAAAQKLVLDAVPFSLGISSYESPGQSQFDILIPKHQTIPTEKSAPYTTVEDNQTVIRIEVYQGENHNPNENFKVGQFVLDGIPLAKAGIPKIEVTFAIDANCILSVSARDEGTRRERSIKIADSLLLTPAQISSFKEKLQDSQIYQNQLGYLAKITSELETLIGEALQINLTEMQIRLSNRINYYEANRSRFDPAPADNETLLAVYRERDELETASRLITDKLAIFSHSFAAWRERSRTVNSLEDKTENLNRIKEIVTEGNSLLKRATKEIATLDVVAGTYRRWLNVLEELSVNTRGDAGYLAKHFLSISRYEEALEHFNRLPQPVTHEQAELGLEILARSRNREGYAEFLDRNADLLGIRQPDLFHLNRAVRLYSHSVVWLQHNAEEHLVFGSGFFIGQRFIATNRHVIMNELTNSPVPPESIRIVTKEKILRVSSVYIPSSGNDDVAVLELTEDEASAVPLRLAYSELVEVGERILTLGFTSPDPSNFEENLYCNTGLVNRIKQSELCSERVLEISIELQGGISGAPILNEMGEVIGLVTYSLQRQHTREGGQLQIEKSFYAIPVGVLRQLCNEVKTLVASPSNFTFDNQ